MTPEIESKTKEALKAQLSHWLPVFQNNKTEADCAGILLSTYFKWDGMAILKAAAVGLEDANYHQEAAIVESLISMNERNNS
jgi:hypothetical protein